MSVAGSIYFYKDFIFNDGNKADKLFVILCDPVSKYYPNYLVALTTSQEKAGRSKSQGGCGLPSNPSYFYPIKVDSFHIDTWIVFDQIYEVTSLDLMTQTLIKKAEHKFALKAENFRALLNCVSKSEDISLEQMSAIKLVQKEQVNNIKK